MSVAPGTGEFLERESVWGGFSAAPGSPSSITLKIASSLAINGSGRALMQYSVDGGASWLGIYDETASFTQRTDSVSIPIATDLTLLRVRAYESADSTESAADGLSASTTHTVYEIWLEVVS